MAEIINKSIAPYLKLNGNQWSVVRKRAHSKAYHDEVKRCTELGYTKGKSVKQARNVACAASALWETKVT